jgi:hypothetical protein
LAKNKLYVKAFKKKYRFSGLKAFRLEKVGVKKWLRPGQPKIQPGR